jgi:hypothetical protein
MAELRVDTKASSCLNERRGHSHVNVFDDGVVSRRLRWGCRPAPWRFPPAAPTAGNVN